MIISVESPAIFRDRSPGVLSRHINISGQFCVDAAVLGGICCELQQFFCAADLDWLVLGSCLCIHAAAGKCAQQKCQQDQKCCSGTA